MQLRAEFGFDEAAALASYLSRLGISHLYCSPYFQARRGSAHGYDVVDPTRISDELGGAEGHRHMTDALAAEGLGHVLDIVPNHMAIGDRANAWWWDVLKRGAVSPYASFFDIDWDPPQSKLHHKVLVPILDDHYGRALDAGEVRLVREDGEIVVRYHHHALPLTEESSEGIDDVRLAELNDDVEELHALLEAQHYRLARWRSAAEELNYRRFFAINDLVALRMENQAVFARTHELILSLLAEDRLQGIRVDHVDGLRRPAEYLAALRDRLPDAYIVVEKILERGEELPLGWPVQGTTGYDFLNLVTDLFVDPSGAGPLDELYTSFTGEAATLEHHRRDKKLLLIFTELASDLERLTDLLAEICERSRGFRDYTRRELRRALAEVAAAFPVYRTYANPVTGEVSEADRNHIEEAIAGSRGRRDDVEDELLDLIRSLLLLEHEGPLEHNLSMRFQQFTAPVMAKGIEDTLFFTYNRFAALNEVGGDPGRFGIATDEFHRAAAAAQDRWPSSILTTSTHDTKRSDDVRARLVLLSEMPDAWASAVTRWAALNDRHRSIGMPDRNMEYLLYQTLVGAWPLDVERATRYMEKASKEAKVHTSWVDPNASYDEALRGFTQGVIEDEAFTRELAAFVEPLVELGRINSLAQTLLKLTYPGVPDLYQGSEVWDLSLVDPDNRRPVDYARRRALLDAIEGAPVEDVMQRSEEGAPKLHLIRTALALRRARPHSFGAGSTYQPLGAFGAHYDHVLAHVRGSDVVAVAPRLVLGLRDGWGDTNLQLPEGTWNNVLTGDEGIAGEISLNDLLVRFPVALLEMGGR